MATRKKRAVMSHDPLEEMEEVTSISNADEDCSQTSVVSTMDNSDMQTKIKSGSEIEIELGESLTIQEVSETVDKVSSVFDTGSQIIIKSNELMRVDGAGVQLLCAIFKEASLKQVGIRLHEPTEALRTAATYLGMSELLMPDELNQ